MTSSFNMYPSHRSSILTTISLLNSNLPEMPTTPIKFFIGLEPYSKLLKACHSDVRKRKKGKGVEEKSSIAGHSIQFMNDYLNNDQSNAAILQQMLALLMQVHITHCVGSLEYSDSRYWLALSSRLICSMK